MTHGMSCQGSTLPLTSYDFMLHIRIPSDHPTLTGEADNLLDKILKMLGLERDGENGIGLRCFFFVRDLS